MENTNLLMLAMMNFFRRKTEPTVEALLGDWDLIQCDDPSMRGENGTSASFDRDGNLIYTFHQKDKDQIIVLTYRVEDNFLVTNQPSHPREERTQFTIDHLGRLVLSYDGSEGIFRRKDQE